MPTIIIQGERVGRQGKIRTGCSAIIFDARHEKILLTRRTDNGLWCLPGGGIDPGESASEACVREIREETGLNARVTRLIGVYSSPDWLVEYPDGNKVQIVALSFEAEALEGDLSTNSEVSEFGYFTPQEIEHLDVMLNHVQRIKDALENQGAAFVR